MKKLIVTLFCAGYLFLTQSCADYLDKDPSLDTNLNYQEIFSDVHFAPGFLNNIYNTVPDGFSRFGSSMLAEACDEAVCSNSGSNIQLFNKNAINATTNPDDVWDNMYKGIRKCNIFLNELQPDGIITKTNSIPEVKDGVRIRDYYKGQAFFLRALFHFELLKRYGNIFYVSKVLDPFNEEELFAVNQLPFSQVADSIANDCDSASVYMPATYPDDSYKGRPVKMTPLALKSRVLLYAASPLNNPTNDKSKWKRAADAAKVIIDSKKYSLNSSFTAIFNTLYNPEIIFAARAFNRNDIEVNNYPVSYQGAGNMNPTEDLVEAFGMASKTYKNRYQGYNSEDPYSINNAIKRENRFKYTVFFNTSKLKDTIVSTYVGGKDGLFSTPTATKTGYYMSKFVDQTLDLAKGNTSNRAWIYMRYAEILLNYAEALNEYDNVANFSAITSVLNSLRARSGQRNFDAADNTLLKDQNEMRKYIKLERRLELAFEEHRFWDLRRWKDAETVLNQPVKGMRITKDDSGNFTYTVFDADTRTFDTKMYWYPIPRKEILKYRNAGKTIIQNPGWE
ncbi:RagB/SusD family nutrient uptake outer membrane protein [uncultured Bacteroides sp.]|uniref:RagB/SusD family nutrient uptake outer membrane protein n=1 Tax=uncultured Bacteroides sp. TaxID=162156 RepID=UPI002AAB497A|nr:RagB/SusD family nutrient uptake outer membrane protein [uncultured Bacteroides sp.]